MERLPFEDFELGELPELSSDVDFYAIAEEARGRQLRIWEALSDEEKAEAIREHMGLMGC